MHEPPATGHSNTFVVPIDGPTAVGENVSLTVQVPGPVKPPPAPQVPKSNPNGALSPSPTRPPSDSPRRP